MAKDLQKKAIINIPPGTVIQGKWNKKKYIIKQKIGAGMVGTVYLCHMKQQTVALKISGHAFSLTTEVNVLKSLNKVQDQRLGPFLLDVDDWESPNGQVYSFYVMHYIKGISLEKFIKLNGDEWTSGFLIQMLEKLEHLHDMGWVFGDLKNDNILVVQSPVKVQFVDVGGTTKIGRSIKEYTEFYDRAYWRLGTREAEPSYDLFALVMVILAVYYPRKFKRTDNSKQLLLKKINSLQTLPYLRKSLRKAILGNYTSARQMREDILESTITLKSKKKRRKRHQQTYLPEAFFIAFISFIFYVFSQLLF